MNNRPFPGDPAAARAAAVRLSPHYAGSETLAAVLLGTPLSANAIVTALAAAPLALAKSAERTRAAEIWRRAYGGSRAGSGAGGVTSGGEGPPVNPLARAHRALTNRSAARAI